MGDPASETRELPNKIVDGWHVRSTPKPTIRDHAQLCLAVACGGSEGMLLVGSYFSR